MRLLNWSARIARAERPFASARAFGPNCSRRRAASASVRPRAVSAWSSRATSSTGSVCQARSGPAAPPGATAASAAPRFTVMPASMMRPRCAAELAGGRTGRGHLSRPGVAFVRRAAAVHHRGTSSAGTPAAGRPGAGRTGPPTAPSFGFPSVRMTRPVRQWMLPARYRFSLFPGVSTAACSPRFIHMHPTFGFRFTSTSSMNTAVSSAGRPLSNARRRPELLLPVRVLRADGRAGPPPHQPGRPAARGGPSPARPAPGSPPAGPRPPPRTTTGCGRTGSRWGRASAPTAPPASPRCGCRTAAALGAGRRRRPRRPSRTAASTG